MADRWFGYPDRASFEKAMNAEMAKGLMHSSTGREMERERQRRPQKQAEETFKLRGEPGSPERMEQVTGMVEDPTLISELAWSSVGTHLQNSLHTIRAYEESDFYDPDDYPPEVIDAFTSSARMLGQVGDERLVQ